MRLLLVGEGCRAAFQILKSTGRRGIGATQYVGFLAKVGLLSHPPTERAKSNISQITIYDQAVAA